MTSSDTHFDNQAATAEGYELRRREAANLSYEIRPVTGEEREHVLRVRDQSIALMHKATGELMNDPDNSSHAQQINYCMRSYIEAEILLDPSFGR